MPALLNPALTRRPPQAAGVLDDIFAPATTAAYSTTNRPPTTRPAVRPGAFGSPGFNNARALYASQGKYVGKTAYEAALARGEKNAQLVHWKDAVGVSPKDQEFRGRQDAFYGHSQAGNAPEDPQLAAWKQQFIDQARGGSSGGATDPASAGGAAQGDPAAAVPDFLTGDLPYTAGVVNNMSADAASKRASDLESAQEELFLSGARGGAFQPAQQAAARANTQAARSGLSGDISGIRNTATQANFAAKQQNLDRQLQEKTLALQDQWKRAENDTQRYAIEQEMERLRVSGEQALAQLQASASAGAAGAGRARGWELEDRADQRAYEQSIYERDLPFLLSNYEL